MTLAVRKRKPVRHTGFTLFPEIDQLFSDLWKDDTVEKRNYNKTRLNAPASNILENENAFVIEIALPGWTKKNIQIEVKEDILKIYSELEADKKETEKISYRLREFATDNFERSFRLPKTVNTENINAQFKNGILRITLAKQEAVKPRAIEVK